MINKRVLDRQIWILEGLPIILPYFIPCIKFPAFCGIIWTLVIIPVPEHIIIAYTVFGIKLIKSQIKELKIIPRSIIGHKISINKFILSSLWTLTFFGLTLIKRFRKSR